MKRSLRVIVAVLALLLLVAGTAFATRSPQGEQHAPPAAASHGPSSPDENADDASASPEPSESEAPESEAPDTKADTNDATDTGTTLTDDHAQALVDLLAARGITGVTTDELKTLAAKYGVGGAVRLEAWAAAMDGTSATDLAKMYDDSGLGWGAFAKQLEQADSSLSLSPGLGWIMGHGHGHAPANPHAASAPGQVKKHS